MMQRMIAGVLVVALAVTPLGAASAGALEDMSVDGVADWLASHNLDGAFAERFAALQYDGEVLAHFLKAEDMLLTDFPDATAAHVAKLFSRIQRHRALSHASAPQTKQRTQNRRLDSSLDTFAGINIPHNNSGIVLGESGDVNIVRAGPGVLATDSTLKVQGIDMGRAVQGLSAGGVAWDFSHPGTRHFLRSAPDFTLGTRFTIELWVWPTSADSGRSFLSFASADNNNCLLMFESGFKTIEEWHHIVVTYDRKATSVHDNGEPNQNLLHGDFCGDHEGSLVLGQEQDTVGGSFDWEQSSQYRLDTVAVYDRAFGEEERTIKGKTCVDRTDPTLSTLWTGYTRGADQVGINPAELYFDGYVQGASSESCSIEGQGVGTAVALSTAAYSRQHATPAVGAVGWVFPGKTTEYHFFVQDLVLPMDWTLEMWVYPLNNTASTYFLSFASDDNNNCLLLKAFAFADDDLRTWHHLVVTFDGVETTLYVNGKLRLDILYSNFCEDREGSLSIGQEQDSNGGNFDADQAAALILDTVAIYDTAWTHDRIIEQEESPCINLADTDLYALWSGYSRGKDLVGSFDGEVFAAEILSPGQSTSSGDAYEWLNGDVVFEIDVCQEAQDQVAAKAPTFDQSLVGGVGWDFLGDSTTYYFQSAANFTFPEGAFTIEFWMYPRTTVGYILSFASTDNNNCLLLKNGYVDVNNWHHVAVVVGSDFTTTVYVNGTETSSWLHSSFCGDYQGGLSIGQEQDSVAGTYDASQASNVIIDTLAIYNTAWDADEVGLDRPVGVNMQRLDLYALYSGFTRGKDLVGNQDATVSLYQVADGMPNSDSNVNTLDMISPSSVGGVSWYFPSGQTDYVIESALNLPTGGFALEMWINIESYQDGAYFVSFCSEANCNCMLAQTAGFSDDDVGVWRHFVMTYDADADSTHTYLDGVENSDLIHSPFCGDTSGAFVIAQEQDAAFGGYDESQASNMYVDTVAIYSSYWDEEQVNMRKGQCVNLHDPTLFTVWSGYTRGQDLVGTNEARVLFESYAEGADLDCSES